MSDIITVRMGEYAVVIDSTKIAAVLGSCVGVVIYDDFRKISGLSHIMLPSRSDTQEKAGKYADTAIIAMIDEMISKGARRNMLKAKVVGGASLHQIAKKAYLRIGERNIKAVEKILADLRIKIVTKDVGGKLKRSIIFNPKTSQLSIIIGNGEGKII